MQNPKKPDFWRLICVIMCAVVFCGVFSYSTESFAQGATPVAGPTSQGDPNVHYTGDLFCPYNYDGLTGRVVHCIQAIVIQAAKDFLAAFLPFYEAIVLSVLVLAVTIYGAMIAMGTVQKPTGQSFFFIFKLAAVAFFTLEFGQAIDMIFDIMEGLLLMVTNYVTVSQLSACSDDGHLSQFFTFDRGGEFTVWDKVDCLFITLLGIGVAQTTAFGLVMILSPLIFTGGIGLIIFVIAIFFILTLLVAVLRAIKIYLVSVITVAFLLCISPLVIPLLMFSHTRPIFDKWLKYLANYMLVPVFLFAYLSMIVAAYDAILFKGPSSLYYAIASAPSQEADFNFRDWVEVGASGKASRHVTGPFAGQVRYSEGGDAILDSGDLVGRNIPGVDALSILQYMDICDNGTEAQRDLAGDICDADLETMFECALNPKVPYEGVGGVFPEDGTCLDVEGNNYHGFLRSDEILHFAIAPNIDTDKDAREKRKKDCGRNPFCHVGNAIGKVAGWGFSVVKNVVGAIARVSGELLKIVGTVMKGIGSLVQGGCRLPSIPGAICDAAAGAFMVSGSVVHASGTFVDFSGRVLMNGLMAELGELFQGWFDVETLDLQKVASHRCVMEGGASDPRDEAFITTCPGPKDIVMDILYVLITASVVAYLMLKWLNYIPSLGREMIGAARVEAGLPGEQSVQKGVGKLQHGLEAMVAKRKGMGKK